MPVTPTSPRRFHFGLRSLFLLVTVVSVATAWVTYSLNWIQQRHALMELGELWADPFEDHVDPVAPGGLWVLGERGRWKLYTGNHDIRIEAERLFPEAEIVELSH